MYSDNFYKDNKNWDFAWCRNMFSTLEQRKPFGKTWMYPIQTLSFDCAFCNVTLTFGLLTNWVHLLLIVSNVPVCLLNWSEIILQFHATYWPNRIHQLLKTNISEMTFYNWEFKYSLIELYIECILKVN